MIWLAFEPELDAIRDIRMPDPVSRAPQTWGWWVLFVVVAIALVLVARWARRRWLADAYRRAALDELAALERKAASESTRAQALAAVPTLLKRTALAAWPREDVAALSGDAWLAFLDRTYPGDAFHGGAGRVVADLAYGQPAMDEAARAALFAAARAWVGQHRA